MAKRRSRGKPGLLRRGGALVVQGLQWALSHPQPFLVVVIAAACALGLWRVLTDGDAFRITAIELPADSALEVPDLRGRNLWTVDARSLAETLNAKHPQLQWVRVVRVPPHTLRIDSLERTPVAQLQLDQWHPVDAEGFVFPAASPTPREGLVALRGVGEPKVLLKAGRINEGPRLKMALRLAEALRHASTLKGHRITAVDVSDPHQVSFVMDDDMEVRCGSEEELFEQLNRLRLVLQRVTQQAIPVRYIDVRFPEPVVGPRT